MNNEFREFISNYVGPATSAEMAAVFLATRPIDQAYREKALFRQVEQDVRKAINADRHADGTPRLISVLDVDKATGKARRVYKQLDLFRREDYIRTWWAADRREKKAKQIKHNLERHHDGRGVSPRPLRDIIKHGDLFDQGAA